MHPCVCGSDFSIPHAFSCPHGAFPTIRHSDIRDFTVFVLPEVCHDVKVKPVLQQLSGEDLRYKTTVHDDDACLATDFWAPHHQHAFFDVRVFNSFAPSSRCSSSSATFWRHEQEK